MRSRRWALQIMVSLVLFSFTQEDSKIPDGRVQDMISAVMVYGTRDLSMDTVKETVVTVMEMVPVRSMSWPCNEVETLALATDSTAKAYTFRTEKEEMMVYSSLGGTVLQILDGKIRISHGNGLETVYTGCSDVYVNPLQKVRKGELIASIRGLDDQAPELGFQILKEQQPVDIGDYL